MKGEKSISKLTEEYIASHQSVKNCLLKGMINYSALARVIAKELGIEKKASKDAVLVAARRYYWKSKKSSGSEDAVRKLLSEGEMEIKNKVIVAILDTAVYKEKLRELQKKVEKKADLFHTIEGSKTITVITTQKYKGALKEVFRRNIIKIREGLIEIVLKSPPEIESTPGVVSYILHLFSENNVNIYELMSCWTDTILVVSEEDLPRIMNFMKF
ncbi:hypothetical protein D6764_04235 [Candidatus Woesearchaeota archaeon]|nr:MAG: hypothetical protein D6764_04235 [Candidatus Woesearchaeota archaeon]